MQRPWLFLYPNVDMKGRQHLLAIIALGQELRGDDAAGLEAVRRWAATYPQTAALPGVVIHLAGLPGLGLLDLLAGSRSAILVDAVASGAAPGSLHLLKEDQLASFAPGSGSAHGWAVAETLVLGRRLYPDSFPEDIALLGIEIASLEPGAGLSSEVSQSLEQAVETIERLLNQALGSQPVC
jgi:hydrogenase maturation protease